MAVAEGRAQDAMFRVYTADECGSDGYPFAWHRIDREQPGGLKDIVRVEADHRCERCGHPYRVGEQKMELNDDGGYDSWTPCDKRCTHGPVDTRLAKTNFVGDQIVFQEARARILTVHHLNGVKADCRWWNLAALCQRCHLTIQGRVVMERAFIFEHSDWMKPHAAGFYALKYLGETLTREQASARQDELLALERLA